MTFALIVQMENQYSYKRITSMLNQVIINSTICDSNVTLACNSSSLKYNNNVDLFGQNYSG